MAKQTDDNSYYQDRTAWSNSMFKKLLDNPYAFDDWFQCGTQDPVNSVFSNGQYLHDYMARMIDPTYESECDFLFLPEIDKRTKAGKEQLAGLLKGVDVKNVYQLAEADKPRLERLADSFLSSHEFQDILRNSTDVFVEKEFRREYGGLQLKGKLDFGCTYKGKKITLDWKTSSAFSDFRVKARYYDYDRQAAVYQHISEAECFYFVVFDTILMNRWKIVKVDPKGKFLGLGFFKLGYAVGEAKEYLENGVTSDHWRREILD